MGNSSSSSDKLTDAETTAQKHVNNKDVASLFNLLKQEPVDLFKIVFFNEDNPEDIKNGYDFIHTLLADIQSVGASSSSSSSAVSVLKAFKQTIESNKQKNSTTPGSIERKPFRETPQFDKFPYSYLQFVIFNNPQDLDSFIFLLDNKETFPSPPPASQSLVHDLCSNPRAIELLRHLISSGEFPERFKNSSSTNTLDEQMRGSVNSVVIEEHRSFTPLQAACAAVNKLAVQELCVAGLGGSNYGECAETLLTTAIAGEQHHNLGSMVLFKKENRPQEISADDVSDILLCLLAQPNGASSIRTHRVKLSLIRSRKVRDGVVAVFKSQFNVSPDTMNLMHLAFALYETLSKKTKTDASANTFLKTALDNKLAVCAPEELTLSGGVLFSKGNGKLSESEIENAFKKIAEYRLREWLISGEQDLDVSSCKAKPDDDSLQRVSSAFPSLQSLNLGKCEEITESGLQHLATLSSLRSLELGNCKLITDDGLQHFAKLPSLRSLNLTFWDKITDSGLQHLANLSSLQTLSLRGCKLITDSGVQHLEKLSSLQELDLCSCELITDAGLQHVSKLSSLQSLNLRYCKLITDNGLQHLAKLTSLQTLDLQKCESITDNGLQHLANLSSLQSLDLESCYDITDSGLEHLAQLVSLQTLNLYSCGKITGNGLQHLAKMSTLQSLNLYNCRLITDDGLAHLAKLSFLRSLNLGFCELITDNGLEHLAKLSSLESLDLKWSSKIGDGGIQHLAKLPSLRDLNLEQCDNLTDDGLEHIGNLSSLQSLNLKWCHKVTSRGLGKLRTKLPLTTGDFNWL